MQIQFGIVRALNLSMSNEPVAKRMLVFHSAYTYEYLREFGMEIFVQARDAGNFFEEIQSTINSIRNIKDLSDLEIFCEEFGLNDIDNEMSFPSLVKKAYS